MLALQGYAPADPLLSTEGGQEERWWKRKGGYNIIRPESWKQPADERMRPGSNTLRRLFALTSSRLREELPASATNRVQTAAGAFVYVAAESTETGKAEGEGRCQRVVHATGRAGQWLQHVDDKGEISGAHTKDVAGRSSGVFVQVGARGSCD